MKMVHRNCGGIVEESKTIPNYVSEDCGTVPAYECVNCSTEILGDSQIQFIPEGIKDEIQIESMFNYESSPS